MLLMKKIFFPAIRSGAKTTTLRYWRRPNVRHGSIHRVPGLGRIRIEEVACVQAAALTAADARSDGFADLPELLSALAGMYPRLQRQGRRLYRIRFSLLPPSLPVADTST